MSEPPEKDYPRHLQRVVRVFISSTIQDMKADRDFLAKYTFPELRRRCRVRNVDFIDVDLRWGISTQQSTEGQTLPVCLKEIDNCRPYFIGMLGERYGWVPQRHEMDTKLLAENAWLREQVEKGKSVTELEILYGVLQNPRMDGRAFFYIRDPQYLNRFRSTKLKNSFVAQTAQERSRLQRLKQKIRESNFQVREDYANPRALSELVLKDLWEAIEREFPALGAQDEIERLSAEQEAFALSRTRVYVARPDYYQRLNAHMLGDGPPLILTGKSGLGKTALLANWAIHHRARHPDKPIWLNFIGTTPDSTRPDVIMRRITAEIQKRWAPQLPIPETRTVLQASLPKWLDRIPGNIRVALILDGINQLIDPESQTPLNWLPHPLPPYVRLFASTISGPSLDAAHRRGWQSFQIEPLTRKERKAIALNYLGRFGKTPDQAFLDKVASAPQTANPLFLKALLEEMRLFGEFEQVSQRLEGYLTARNVPQLFTQILERLEKDYRKPAGIVADALSLLWAAPRGLTEGELRQLLGSRERPLPAARWSPLFLALQESLVSRNGYLGFFHNYLRQAVQKRYMSSLLAMFMKTGLQPESPKGGY